MDQEFSYLIVLEVLAGAIETCAEGSVRTSGNLESQTAVRMAEHARGLIA
jgi:hypothetical protein